MEHQPLGNSPRHQDRGIAPESLATETAACRRSASIQRQLRVRKFNAWAAWLWGRGAAIAERVAVYLAAKQVGHEQVSGLVSNNAPPSSLFSRTLPPPEPQEPSGRDGDGREDAGKQCLERQEGGAQQRRQQGRVDGPDPHGRQGRRDAGGGLACRAQAGHHVRGQRGGARACAPGCDCDQGWCRASVEPEYRSLYAHGRLGKGLAPCMKLDWYFSFSRTRDARNGAPSPETGARSARATSSPITRSSFATGVEPPLPVSPMY